MKRERWINRLLNGLLALFGVFVLWIALRIFVCDTFPVNSNSMEPSIIPGDKVWVNKVIFGARVYKNLDFFDGKPMESWRMPGLRPIRRNDAVVFNHSIGESDRGWYKTGFDIRGVYVKRCIGLPGDSIAVVDGAYHNPAMTDEAIRCFFPDPVPRERIDSNILRSFPYNDRVGWTILDFGPLYIPRKGDRIELTPRNVRIYGKFIEYEGHGEWTIANDSVALQGGIPQKEYTFESSYYFMAGENAEDSRDSRYFGLIPEEFIIGVAPRILYSKDRYRDKIRWDRVLKRLN